MTRVSEFLSYIPAGVTDGIIVCRPQRDAGGRRDQRRAAWAKDTAYLGRGEVVGPP
jgi:hypothetical protein